MSVSVAVGAGHGSGARATGGDDQGEQEGAERFASLVRHPGGPPKRTAGADVGTYVAGVAAGFGAVELPDDPPEPLRAHVRAIGAVATRRVVRPGRRRRRAGGRRARRGRSPGIGARRGDHGRRTADEEQRGERCGEHGALEPRALRLRRCRLRRRERRRLDRRQGSRQCRLVMPFQCDLLGSFGLGGCRLVVVASVHGHLRARGRGRRCGLAGRGSRGTDLESIVATRSERDVRAGRGGPAVRGVGSPPRRSHRGSDCARARSGASRPGPPPGPSPPTIGS